MKKKHLKTEIDFSDITPKMQIGKVKLSEEYKKAFLKNNDKNENKFGRNTSSDD